MRFAGLVTTFVLAISTAGPSLAQTQRAPDPVPITEWSRDKIVAMGQEIHRQDVAAWVATDALMEKFRGTPPQGLAGWIVVPDGRDQKVRFLKAEGNVVTAGWDVVVRNGRAGDVVDATGGVLSDQEQARFRARMAAASNIGRLRCSANMNAVVADDPDSDGWLVWLLTSTTDANIVPMGGHYRFLISADGTTVQQRDMLSNSCLPMSRTVPQGGQIAALNVSQIVSDGPVETHVFLSLQQRLPIYVIADDKLFEVNGARIRDVRR